MKTFCFEFYPGEALRQTQFLNLKQKGVYFQIVTAHIDMISFSYDFLMSIMCELSDVEKKQLFTLFSRNSDGTYFIEWVAASIEKRVNFLKSRSLNKKGKKKDTKNISKSYDNHMVNVYVDVKEEVNKEKGGMGEKTKSQKKRKPNTIDEVIHFFKEFGLNGRSEIEAQEFWDWYTNTDWTQGKAKTPLVDWTAAARRWARPKLSNSDKSSNGKKEIIYPSK